MSLTIFALDSSTIVSRTVLSCRIVARISFTLLRRASTQRHNDDTISQAVLIGASSSSFASLDGEGRECRFVSIGKQVKQNAENVMHDFLLYTAEELLRFKVGDQVQARVGG